MSVATERDIDLLVDEYGLDVLARPRMSCYHNALKATMAVFIGSHGMYLPRTWGVNLLDKGDHHAYLVHNGRVYNQKVTWPDATYPDYTLEQLQAEGTDNTAILMEKALVELDELPVRGDLFMDRLASAYPDGQLELSVILAVNLTRGIPIAETIASLSS